MKNLIVANYRRTKENSSKHYSKDMLERELMVQIENSLRFGWNPQDLIVVTNFVFEHRGITSINLNLNEQCLTGSKVFAMNELFKYGLVDDVIWAHDLDAWQNDYFECPHFLDVGIAEYSRPKYNGGSVFYKPSAKDIVEEICDHITTNKEAREEPTLDKFLRGKYAKRTTTINPTFNLGCSGFIKRVERAIKPIKVLHFHPTNRIAWDTQTRDRNNTGFIPISNSLKELFIEHFGNKIKSYEYEDKANPMAVRTSWTKPKYILNQEDIIVYD